MDFAKSHLLWYLTRTPEVGQDSQMQKLVQKETVEEKDFSTGSRLWELGAPLAAGMAAAAGEAVVAVPAAVGFATGVAGSLAAKAKSLAVTTGYVTTSQEPGQENDSSTGSRLRRIGIPVAAGAAAAGVTFVVVPLVVGALGFGAGGIAAGSLATKIMSLAATTGHGMSVIGGLQSVGAVGLTASKAFLVGSTVTAAVSMSMNDSGNEDKKKKE